MMHTATRVHKGNYHYRGYEIEDQSNLDSECKYWNIRELSEYSAHDSENTLAQCKALIDWWIDG
jgi:hypothetical protein